MQRMQKSINRTQSPACCIHCEKFDNTGVGVEDLISIGTIGLIKAINTFNPTKDQTCNIRIPMY